MMAGWFSRYGAFARISYHDHLRHGLRFALRFFFFLLFSLVFAQLWKVVVSEGLVNIPWPMASICWYAALAQMMLFLSPRLFLVIENDVRSGDIAYFLTRPLSYVGMRMAEGFGAMMANVSVYCTAGLPLLALGIGAWPDHVGAMLVGLGLMVTGSVIHLLMQVFSGLTALWLHDADTVYRMYQKILIVMGGLYLPVSLYPEGLQAVAKILPFYAMLGAPLEPMLEGSLAAVPGIIMLQMVWMGFAAGLVAATYAICRRRVEINGG